MPSSKPLIAVLPFDNSGSADREYFADGITDEVIARLARLKEIGVISQSSAAQYKKSSKRPRDIGQELGCGYLLQGNIRWDESSQPPRVRINVKLTKVLDETYLWAETYDRVLDQIFVVQSDIADQVARELGASLAVGKQADPSSGGTQNLEAYDLYLRAREHFPASIEVGSVREAARLLHKALELDPDYAVALALLGWGEVALFWLTDRESFRLRTAKEFIDRAFDLSPELFDAHVAMGYYHYWGRLDYEPALEHFGKALALRPNDAEVLFAVGVVERRQGKIDDSIRRIDLAIRLNPRGHLMIWNQAQSMLLVGKYKEAVELGNRAVTIRPDGLMGWGALAIAASSLEGSFDAGAKILQRASEQINVLKLVITRPMIFVYAAYHGNDYGRALDSLDVSHRPPDPLSFLETRFVLAQLAGRAEVARAYAEAIVAVAEDRITSEPEDFFCIAMAASAYCELGLADKARERAAALKTTRTFVRDPVDRPIILGYLVEIYGRLGDLEEGLECLRQIRNGYSLVSPKLATQIPATAYYSHLPEFWKILGLELPAGVS